MTHKKVDDLLAAARRARTAYEWEEAAACYTQALSLPDLAPEQKFELYDKRALCHWYLADYRSEHDDLDAMVELGQESGNLQWTLEGLTRQALALNSMGEIAKGRHVAERAHGYAQEASLPYYQARAKFALGSSYLAAGEHAEGSRRLAAARESFQELGALKQEAECSLMLAFGAINAGQDSRPHAERGMVIARQLDDRLLTARAHQMLGFARSDEPGVALRHHEQAGEIYRELKARARMAVAMHNLGHAYLAYGLTKRAYALFQGALDLEGPHQSTLQYLTMVNFARAAFATGSVDEALAVNEEVVAETRDGSLRRVEGYALVLRGMILHTLGQPAAAREALTTATERLKMEPGFLIYALAQLALVCVADGDLAAGLRASEEALQLTEEMPEPGFPGLIHWARYRVLRAAAGGTTTEEAWRHLEHAHQVVLEQAGKFRDRGLRRSYLVNTLFSVRTIVLDWANEAHTRAEKAGSLIEQPEPDSLEHPFKRLLAFGARLTAQRDVAQMPRFVVDEFVELSGAERAFLALFEDEVKGPSSIAATEGMEEGDVTAVYEAAAPFIEEAVLARHAILAQEVGQVPEGAPPAVHQRSLLILPLVSRSRVTGVLYGDVRAIFGPFSREDGDLLTPLANQAAAALENANWTHTLEKRVRDRTLELETINKIGEGLLAELDLDGILEVVGNHVQEHFGSRNIIIVFSDPETGRLVAPYMLENGRRLEPDETPAEQTITAAVIERNAPLLLRSFKEVQAYPYFVPKEMRDLPLEEVSWIGVPLRRGEEAIGALVVFELQDHAYDESHVRLLTTIAQNLGVALENARLFDETQRLLIETEERNAELAIINSVQDGLASKLDIEAIFELVGHRIAEVFPGNSVSLYLLDEATGMGHAMFVMERGVRHYPPPRKPGPIAQRAIERMKPLLISNREEFDEIGATVVEGTEPSLSGIYAPLIVHGRVIGAMNIESVDEEHAFSESDLRLVTTISNSMSVALENARLFDETQRLLKETEERNAELAVINSVQAGLVAKMDMQAIIDLVGDRVQEIFDAEVVVISRFDLENRRHHYEYVVEEGERFSVEHQPFNPIIEEFIQNQRTFLVNEGVAEQLEAAGAPVVAGKQPLSVLSVPLLRDEHVTGAISLQNVSREHAFSPSDVQLLETLASSLSVALENARLFDETQRLLKETEERNAELSIINSVQAGLVAQVGMQGIYDLVGDEIRRIFDAQVVTINRYDHERRLNEYWYAYEKGERLPFYTNPISPLGERFIEEGETWLINEGVGDVIAEGEHPIAYGEMPKSVLSVPLRSGEKITGYVSLQNIDREHAFADSDVRLLQTLANSMSVALENARLFEAEQERVAELQVINSIQQGLVARIGMQEIYDLVGDQVRGIFDAQAVMIATFDHEREMVRIPYMFEKGERYHIEEERRFNPFSRHLIATKGTVVTTGRRAIPVYGLCAAPGSRKGQRFR